MACSAWPQQGQVAILDVDHHLVAWQVCRQRPVVTVRRLGARLACEASSSGRGVLAGLVGGNGLLQLLEGQLQLIGCQLLGPAAKLVPRQALDQQPQFVVLGGKCTLLKHDRPQHQLQGGGVVGQGGEIDLHTAMMTDVAASRPVFSGGSAAF